MLWRIIATVAAYFVKGVCGFTNGLVFTTILSFTTDNVNISPLSLVIGYPTNLIIAWKNRKSINWKMCTALTALVILGNIPGAYLLKNADTSIIKFILGFIIIYLSVEMFLNENRKHKKKSSKLALGIVGVLAGLVSGIYGVGALLGVYVNKITNDTKAFKANANVVYFVSDTFRLCLYIAWGIVTWDIVKQAVVLVPFMLFSLLLGMKLCNYMNEKAIRRIVILMLIISGSALIINNCPWQVF